MEELIKQTWQNRELLNESKYSNAVREVIELLDKGKLRCRRKLIGWIEHPLE